MLIYISLPFTGCEEKSKKRSAEIALQILSEIPNATVVNPVLNFSFCDNTVSYNKCIQMCLDLLARCDIIIYEGKSKGVLLELEHAKKEWVKIIKYENDLSELKEYTSKYELKENK